MPRNGSLTLTQWPLLAFHTGIQKDNINSGFTGEPLCSIMATQVLVTTVRFPSGSIIGKERKTIKSFQPFLGRWTDFKISINGSRIKCF